MFSISPNSDMPKDNTKLQLSSGLARPRLDSARRARKRESDRRSQKATRERTKNYITHLEQLVETLGKSKENDKVEVLTQQLRKEREENEKFKGIITGISRLIRGVVISDEPNLGGSDSALSSSLGAPAAAGFDLCDQTQFLSVNPLMQELPTHFGAECQPPGQFPIADSSSTSLLLPRAICDIDQATPNLETSISGNLALQDESLTNNNDDINMFAVVDNMLNRVLRLKNRVIRTNMLQDADIVLRAIFYGWVEIEAQHILDIGWQLLRHFDETLFSNTGPVERLAILRLLRLKLRQDTLGVGDPSYYSLPSFMTRRPPQNPDTYRTLVDYFAWPRLREFLILEGCYNIPRKAVAMFSASLQFHWPFDLQDVCLRNRNTGQYSFSSAFHERFLDIRWWTLSPEFIQQHPWVGGQFPVYEPSVEFVDISDVTAIGLRSQGMI